MHGFIGIILSGPTYDTLVPYSPFISPVHPGALTYVAGSTQYNIAAAKTLHEEANENISHIQLGSNNMSAIDTRSN